MNATVVHVLVLCAVITAAGSTVTLTENVAPFVQVLSEVGETLYTAVTALAVRRSSIKPIE